MLDNLLDWFKDPLGYKKYKKAKQDFVQAVSMLGSRVDGFLAKEKQDVTSLIKHVAAYFADPERIKNVSENLDTLTDIHVKTSHKGLEKMAMELNRLDLDLEAALAQNPSHENEQLLHEVFAEKRASIREKYRD